MNILLVNKYFYLKGGAEHVFFRMRELLKKHGHKVIDFSMQDEQNLESDYSHYFVSNKNYFDPSLSFKKKMYFAKELLYSSEAREKMKSLLENEKIDIVHLHNIYHQLSTSFLDLFKEYNIPVVMTIHDYKLLCPNYSFLSHNHLCEKCKGGKYYNIILNRCHKNSLLSSSLLALEAYLNDFRKVYEKNIDLLLYPSEFIQNKFKEYNVNIKGKVLRNFIHLENYQPSSDLEDYILYYGRLSEEKGIDTIIKAMQYFKSYNIKLKIVGSGHLKANLLKLVEKLSLQNWVEFIPYQSGEALNQIIAKSRLVILASRSYENAPLSVLEAFAMGKVIIASNIGGIPELLLNEKNLYRGELFEVDNYLDLKDKIRKLYFDKSQLLLMGENARKYVEKYHGAEFFYGNLIQIYNELLKQKQK